jgi:hypothetical protein
VRACYLGGRPRPIMPLPNLRSMASATRSTVRSRSACGSANSDADVSSPGAVHSNRTPINRTATNSRAAHRVNRSLAAARITKVRSVSASSVVLRVMVSKSPKRILMVIRRVVLAPLRRRRAALSTRNCRVSSMDYGSTTSSAKVVS